MPSQLERAYADEMMAVRYPDAPPEAQEAPAAGAKAKAAGSAPPSVGAGTIAADVLASALKGAISQALGLPGDVRELVDLAAGSAAQKVLGDRTFLTTEEFRQLLPSVVPATEDMAKAAAREAIAQFAEEMGTMLPLPAAAASKGARKAVGKALVAATGGVAPTTAKGSEDRRIRYNAKGERQP